ncbi:PAS domain-containing sensor histidine kinase [Haloglomus litoreum]|uniref:PAS domain-containing sensor histidine kinase n=1 Tax=Haloglomus litoreum TaxID=3034026 RepID=UPI0023E84093|nr:PAS domain-containing sensor histidine kinase [Haloglomus sp. DT116]
MADGGPIAVLLVGGGRVAAAIAEQLESASDLAVETTDDPASHMASSFDCIVLPDTTESPDDLMRLGQLRADHPETPMVVVLENPERPPPEMDPSWLDVVQLDDPEADLVAAVQEAVQRDRPEPSDYRETFSALVEHSPAMIAILDETGEYRYVSPSVETVLGYEPDQLIGEDAFALIHEDDRPAVVEEFTDALDVPDHRATVEYRYRHASGDWRVLQSWGKNRLEDPEIDGVLVTTLDVTERKAYERELERRNERLDRFTSVVSHDLRNPLNVIQGHVEAARAGADPDIDAIGRAADRIEAITGDLLTLAREGRTVGETESVDIASVAQAAWSLVDAPDATLEIDDIGTLTADRDRFQALLENLFRNSVEHGATDSRTESGDGIDPGDSAVTVSLGVLADGEGFYVADDGPGIPSDQRESVFDWGHSTSDAGTGFGLAIVRSIAEAHGWTVEATESEAGGARFEIRGVESLD